MPNEQNIACNIDRYLDCLKDAVSKVGHLKFVLNADSDIQAKCVNRNRYQTSDARTHHCAKMVVHLSSQKTWLNDNSLKLITAANDGWNTRTIIARWYIHQMCYRPEPRQFNKNCHENRLDKMLLIRSAEQNKSVSKMEVKFMDTNHAKWTKHRV